MEGLEFRRTSPLLLLTYLSLEGPQEKRHLAELFWPRGANAIRNLATVLSRLNKVDANLIDLQRHLISTSLACDANELAQAFEQGNYPEVIHLYQGRFLEGFYLKGIGEELEEWLYETRESLAGKVRLARLNLAEQKAKAGFFSEAAKEAEKAYFEASAKEPDENDIVQIYKLLVAGDHPISEEVKQKAVSYGLELELTQEEAKEHFVKARVAVLLEKSEPEPRPNNLPKQVTAFVGRQKELELLSAYLKDLNCRLLSLIAPGGMGKTRLALALAEQHLYDSQFKDGIYLIELAALSDPANTPSAVAEALGYQFLGGDREPEQQILDYLRQKQMLLVMDNFEQILNSAELVTRILQAAPGVKILVTSRQRLGQAGETLFQLDGLDLAENLSFEAAFGQPAVQLFLSNAGRAQPGFELTEMNVKAVLQICRQVQGMPLGIMLAASWLVMLTPEEIVNEIQQGLDFLEDEVGEMPERQHSIRVVFNYAWETLSKHEQRVFMTLTAFRGGFTREAAQSVSAADLSLLRNLTNKALLQRDADSGRFRMHELLRQYGYERLAEQQELLNETLDKHARYFATYADQNQIVVWKGGEQQVLADIDNIRMGWQRIIKQRFWDDITIYTMFLFTLYELLGWFQEAGATFEWAADELEGNITDQSHQCALGLVTATKSIFYRRLGLNDRAQKVGGEAFRILSPCPSGVSSTLGLIFCHRHGSAPGFKAVDDIQELKVALLQAAEEVSDSILASWVDLTLGNIAVDQGLFDEAQAYFKKGITWSRTNRAHRGVGWGLVGLTNVAIGREHYELAKAHFLEYINLEAELDARVVLTLQLLAFIEYKLQNYDVAAEICFKILHFCLENGIKPRIDTMLTLAEIVLKSRVSESVVMILSLADHLSLIPADQMGRFNLMTQQLQSKLGNAYKTIWERGSSSDFETILKGLEEDLGTA